jgi:DivIVA domain-containing protein
VTGDDLRNAVFREKLRGYAPDEVDDALELMAERLDRGGSLSRVELDGLEFRAARLRGYHPDDVDALIDRLKAGG